MSILIICPSADGNLKKNAPNLVTYAAKVGEMMGVSEVVALTFGEVADAGNLGINGATKVLNASGVTAFDSQVYADTISAVANDVNASVVLLNEDTTSRNIAGRLAVKLHAGLVSAVSGLPLEASPVKLKKSVFSGKASAYVAIHSGKKIWTIADAGVAANTDGTAVGVETIATSGTAQTTVVSVDKIDGAVPLTEAELVVSGGRGLKGPENWNIVEDMASVLGAATACSRPVADTHWRPHHEHVGQTGVAISPDLYIAMGISGAIQHLGGVNNSKVIVVINNDEEAPFFKAADYGVIGDLFEVGPRLTEALRKFKNQ